MQVGQEELRASWVGKELLGANHAVFHEVVEILDFVTDRFEPEAAIDEVVPCAISMSAFTGMCLFRKVFTKSACVVGGERVAHCQV